MINDSAANLQLEDLAESCVARFRRGECPAITDYVQRYPYLAKQIEEVFPALVAMEQAHREIQQAIPVQPSGAAGSFPEVLGDFRILREVGRGGMGVVYEAEQVSLGRRVALKVLPPRMIANNKQRHRFEREARTAAKLHHTNIVPVFSVGERNGQHYYAMQFIHGLGLDEVLLELHRLRAPATVAEKNRHKSGTMAQTARRSHQIALAGGVAHSMLSGRFEHTVIMDPANGGGPAGDADTSMSIDADMDLRGPLHDTVEGRLSETLTGVRKYCLPGQSREDSQSTSSNSRAYWQSVARIGAQAAEALQYAHDQGIVHRDIKPANLLLDTAGTVWVTDFGLAKAADQQDLTQTGDVLGTLRYMAPEQLEGKTDHRSDIYALGLTLYELLALKPAFDEQDRNHLIKQVATGTPLKLRMVDLSIPRDLETVVHKALERDPGHRYQTAGELADDLKRYLGDEPIRARRISPVVRFGRWCRRNPALASLSSAVGMLLLVTSVVSVVAYKQTSAALIQAEQNEDEARQNAQLAEAKSKEAEANAARAAENALRAEQNELQAKQNAKEAEANAQRANENARQAAESAALAQENEKKALTEAEKSKQATDFLVKLFEGPQPVAWMGMQLDAIGVGSKMTARELLDRGAKQAQIDLKGQPELLAKMLDTLGHIYNSLGYLQEAEPLLLEALKKRRELFGPESLEVAETLEHLGWLRGMQGNRESLQLHRDALTIRRKKLGEEHPKIADSLFNVGFELAGQTRYSEAEVPLRQCLVMRQKLLPPSHPDIGFAMILLVHAQWRDPAKAEEMIQLSAQAEKLFAQINGGHNLGSVLVRFRKCSMAPATGTFEKDFQDVVDFGRQVLGEEHPIFWVIVNGRAQTFTWRAWNENPSSDAALCNIAEKAARDAVALSRKVYGEEHATTSISLLLLAGSLHINRKNVSAAQWKEAEELYRKVLVILESDLKQAQVPDTVSPRRRMIIAQFGLGDVAMGQQKPVEASKWYEKALDGFARFQADYPKNYAAEHEPHRERVRRALEEARKMAEAGKK